ncbi:hypothetical protein IPdc08_00795 [archaeon]|nr:hypothetical protein IPdc08_00795 [archaeon]
MVPKFIISTIVKGSTLNFLIVREGPSIETGGIVALTLEPSGRRASRRGAVKSTLLAILLAIRFMIFIISSSSSKITLVLHIPYVLW